MLFNDFKQILSSTNSTNFGEMDEIITWVSYAKVIKCCQKCFHPVRKLCFPSYASYIKFS